MSSLSLQGLKANSPIAFMAAMGLLKIVHSLDQSVAMSWKDGNAWLYLPETMDKATLYQGLHNHLKQSLNQDWVECWGTDVKMTPAEYRNRVQQANVSDDQACIDFLAAVGHEFAVKTKKDQIQLTPFYMISGQQKLLKSITKLMTGLLNHTEQALDDTLLSRWTYCDKVHTLGWDPVNERLHAYESRKPTDLPDQGMAAAIWLAYEGLTLFPTTLVKGNKLETTCFVQDQFMWPVWTSPAKLMTVKSLLALLPGYINKKDGIHRLNAMGVQLVYKSLRKKTGGDSGDYRIFTQPVVLHDR